MQIGKKQETHTKYYQDEQILVIFHIWIGRKKKQNKEEIIVHRTGKKEDTNPITNVNRKEATWPGHNIA